MAIQGSSRLARKFALALACALLAGCGAGDRTLEEPASDLDTLLLPELEDCPEIVALRATPVAASVGSDIELTSAARGGEELLLSFNWFAPAGSFSDPWRNATRYTCERAGSQILTLLVASSSCAQEMRMGVYCQSPDEPQP